MHGSIGTAISVFNIIPNTVPGSETVLNATFSLDGGAPYLYFRTPDPSSTYLYNQNVYSQQGLENVEHTLVMSPTAGTESSLFIFDYAIYTYVPIISKSRLSHILYILGLTIRRVHLPPRRRLLLPLFLQQLNNTSLRRLLVP
jgi:hypothetical protein